LAYAFVPQPTGHDNPPARARPAPARRRQRPALAPLAARRCAVRRHGRAGL